MTRNGQENLSQGIPFIPGYTLKPFIWLVGAFSPVARVYFAPAFVGKRAQPLRRHNHALTQSQWHKRCFSKKRSAATGKDKRPQLDWRGSSLQDKGLLQSQTRGEPIELHFFCCSVSNCAGSERCVKSPVCKVWRRHSRCTR